MTAKNKQRQLLLPQRAQRFCEGRKENPKQIPYGNDSKKSKSKG
jgi:hypothetical protein